jgi:hypothetical protein
MNQAKFVTNKAVIPGLDPESSGFFVIWIPAPRFHGGKFIPAKAGTGMTNEWGRKDLVIVGFLAFHTSGAFPRSYSHAR